MNFRQTFHNIYNLLKPEGGDCLLASLTYHPIFDGYRMTSQMEKWSKYMSDVDSFISPQQYATNAKGEFQEFLADAGFRDYSVVVHSKVFIYDSLEVYKSRFRVGISWSVF